MSIPEKLRTYLEGHLKRILTLQTEFEGKTAEWGAYFSIRPGDTNGDPEFKGELDGAASAKLIWEHEKSLWIVPLNDKANRLSDVARQENLGGRPGCGKLVISAMSIENPDGGNDWKDYLFSPPVDQRLRLNIEPNSVLMPNCNVGTWRRFKHDGDDAEWNIWYSKAPFSYKFRIIEIDAPRNHIVTEAREYPDFSLYVGVRKKGELEDKAVGPYLGIDDIKAKPAGEDCPFVWTADKRFDDLVFPTSKEAFSTKEFNGKSLGRYFDGNTWNGRAKQILERVNVSDHDDKNDPFDLKSWIIEEEETTDLGKEKRKSLSVIYARSFKPPKDTLPVNRRVKILQVNRDKAHLYVRHKDPDSFYELGEDLIAGVREGIRATQGSSPVGIVPSIEDLKPPMQAWSAEWQAAYGKCFDKEYSLNESFIFKKDDSLATSIKSKSIELPLLRSTTKKTGSKSTDSVKLVPATFSGSVDVFSVNDNGTVLRLLLTDYGPSKPSATPPLTLIDGAFAFELREVKIKDEKLPSRKYGEIRFTLQNKRTQAPFYYWQYHSELESGDLELGYSIEDFSLRVQKVCAAGQDLLEDEGLLAAGSTGAVIEGQGERNDPSLVIPISPSVASTTLAAGQSVTGEGKEGDKNEAGAYLLTFSESVNVGQDYRFDVKLQEVNPFAGADRTQTLKAVILDTNPQFVGLIEARFLQQPGYDDGAWILARRSELSIEKGAWEILDDSAGSDGFKLILPAQAIGEAYVKRDKLDANPKDGEPKEGQPIEYKFGAPAILRIANERLDRRYVSLPWNLRHIWGQPGSELPGVSFLEAQFELLYGLTGHLKPERTFVAELASKLGDVPVPPDSSIFWEPTAPQKNAFEAAWRKYLQFYRAWKSRLAILELSQDDAFANAKFVKNLKYSPRIYLKPEGLLSKAQLLSIVTGLKHLDNSDGSLSAIIDLAEGLADSYDENNPNLEGIYDLKIRLAQDIKTVGIAKKYLPFKKEKGASLRPPIKPDTIATPLDDLDLRILASHDTEDGLAGGFHYGFESKAIYKEFWREAFADGSSSAELVAPAFSSLGGWGKQTAKFAGDKTVIKSTTAMGRTNFYAVERIGRIGVLWHKAKHVIEYERTVVPSEYFPDQPSLAGRPIVRKVREYIEILEPSKTYPDYPGQNDDAPGSVKACHFKSKIIPVKSSWGQDVSFKYKKTKAEMAEKIENYGWEIQLWHPDANPKLFPKPQVVFELIAPADSNVESVIVNLSEPQNLRFYTDTRPEVKLSETDEAVKLTADTSKWPAVKYVDYTDLPSPNEKHLKPAIDSNSGKGMEQPMPELLDVPPGFERFTFRVDKSELPSGVANRYNPQSGISGKMKAVTMMRKPVGLKDQAEKPRVSEYATLAALSDRSDSPINRIYNGEMRGATTVDDFAKKIREFLPSQLVTDIGKLGEIKCENIQFFKPTFDDGITELQTFPAKYLWKEAVVSTEGLLNRTVAIYKEHAKACQKEFDDLKARGETQKEQVISAVNRFRDRVSVFDLNIEYGQEFVGGVESQARRALTHLRARVEGFRASMMLRLTEIEGLVQSDENDLNIVRFRATSLLEKMIAECYSIVEKLNKATLPEVLKARNELITIVGDVRVAADDLKTKVSNLDLTEIRSQLETLREDTSTAIEEYEGRIHSFIDQVEVEIGKIAKQFKDCPAQIKELLKRFKESIVDQIDRVIDTVNETWDKGFDNLEAELTAKIDFIRCRMILNDCTPDDGTLDPCNGIFSTENGVVAVRCLLQTILAARTQDGNDDPLSIYSAIKRIDDWLVAAFGASEIASLIEKVGNFATPGEIEKWLKTFDACKELEAAIAKGDPVEIAARAAALADSVNKEFGKLAGEVAEKVKEADKAAASYGEMVNSGKQVLDNYRSVWDEFTAPGMGLNRKTVSMIVNMNPKEIEQRLSITPCIARVKQFENDLDALGLRLPVTNIFEGLLPPKPEWVENAEDYAKSLLNRFNFSDVLSDIGAMRLDKMFPSFKMPNDLRDNIKITQGFDKQNLIAWVNAEIDFQLGEPKSLLRIGPIELVLKRGKFVAKVRMEMDVEGSSSKQKSGMLAGDWEIRVGSVPMMIFSDAKAIFENDDLTFDLDPSRMEMPGLLKLLTDATKNVPVSKPPASSEDEEGGSDVFNIKVLEIEGQELNPVLAGRQVPIGVRATLDIPPISIGGGTTAMTNLSFGGHFGLEFYDKTLRKFGFMTTLGFYLGKRDAPFNFTVFILGGGGFVDCDIQFRPEQGLTVKFVMSVHASAGLAISAGWINGSVLIMLGLEAEYNKFPQNESRVLISIFVQIIGTVDILGLVTVYLGLRLAATYDGSRLIGTGTVKLKIKICWCLTISVNKQYQKTLKGSDSGSQKKTPDQAANSVSTSLG